MPVLHPKNEIELINIILTKRPVVADFSATWCGPCKQIAPKFEEMSNKQEYANIVFVKVDVDELADYCREINLSSVPAFHFYLGGKAIPELEVKGANLAALTANTKKLAVTAASASAQASAPHAASSYHV